MKLEEYKSENIIVLNGVTFNVYDKRLICCVLLLSVSLTTEWHHCRHEKPLYRRYYIVDTFSAKLQRVKILYQKHIKLC